MFAFGIGLASYSSRGDILDVYYPTPAKDLDAQLSKLLTSRAPADDALSPEQTSRLADALLDAGHARLGSAARLLAEADRPLCWTELDEDRPIETTTQAYLKLHLLSHRCALPMGFRGAREVRFQMNPSRLKHADSNTGAQSRSRYSRFGSLHVHLGMPKWRNSLPLRNDRSGTDSRRQRRPGCANDRGDGPRRRS